VPISHIFNK